MNMHIPAESISVGKRNTDAQEIEESAKGVDCSLYNQLFNQILLFPYFSLTLSCLNF